METISNSVSNPLAQQFNVVVSIPQSVKVKLVDASLLNDFEIWMYLSTFLLNISTGFWVSFAQNTNKETDKILGWTASCFSILLAFSLVVAISKRIKMSKKSRDIQLTTSVSNPAI